MNALEEKLNQRNLPSLFCFDGENEIKTKEEWEKVGRPYWKNILLQEEYGLFPAVWEPTVTAKKNTIDFAGKATWESVTFAFERGEKSHQVETQLIYPKKDTPAPFFIYLNFRPDVPDRYLPVEEIIDHGFGIFAVCYNDITRDNDDFSSGLAGLFSDGERKGKEAGKIVYWAYMASRMMDYLQTRKEADLHAIGVAGHSRLGKTALLAAALDERFAFVCSNDSGCSGAALSRNRAEGGEKIEDICRKFPYWFCPDYKAYVNREENMPFDQHCLLALIAPRRAYIGGAIEDVWADNENQFLCCVAASPAWELYGEEGIVTEDRLPVCGDILTEGGVGFHLRSGKHYHSRTDWLIYMDAVEKAYQRQSSAK